MKVVGIDLGTTNSVVATYHRGEATIVPIEGKSTTPSVVYLGKNTEVGDKAKQRILIDPDLVLSSTKRFMGSEWQKRIGRKAHTPTSAATLILKYLKQQSEKELGEEIRDAVITIPAYFDDEQRKATMTAAENAGFNVLRLLPEPTAAAIAYGLDRGKDQTILVFDLGGGTFDVSILEVRQNEFIVQAVDGNSQLGGDDFDEEIVEFLLGWLEDHGARSMRSEAKVRQKLKELAEEAKKNLSSSKSTEIYCPSIYKGVDLDIPKFTREQLGELIDSFIVEMMEKTNSVMEQAGLTLDDISRIVLVGGSCKSPLIQDAVTQHFRKPYLATDMDTQVAKGAAVVAASLMTPDASCQGQLPVVPDIIVQDVTAHSLGIDMHDPDTEEVEFVPILKKNSRYKCKAAVMGRTTRLNQDTVQINVFRGENKNPRRNKDLGNLNLKISRNYLGKFLVPIACVFELDDNGILTFTAVEIPDLPSTQPDLEDLFSEASANNQIIFSNKVEETVRKHNLRTEKIVISNAVK